MEIGGFVLGGKGRNAKLSEELMSTARLRLTDAVQLFASAFATGRMATIISDNERSRPSVVGLRFFREREW